MPVTYRGDVAEFRGFCVIEEAEDLHTWLQAHEAPVFDLAECEHVHAAVLQLLLRVQPRGVRLPETKSLRAIMQRANWPTLDSEDEECA